MNIPILDDNKCSLLLAHNATGHIFKKDLIIFSEGENPKDAFRIFDNLQSAKEFAQRFVRNRPEFECIIYDHAGKHVITFTRHDLEAEPIFETPKKDRHPLRTIGLACIIIATLIAVILAMTADMEGVELGVVFNLIIPLFAGVIAVLLYLLIYWVVKNKLARIVIIVFLCSYLLYVGLAFQLRKGYLPYPF